MPDLKWNNAGLIGVIVLFLFTQMAILNYPGFNSENQYVSDLGTGHMSAFWFNTGLVLAGLLFALFFFEFYKNTDKDYKQIGMLGIGFALGVIGVGVFPSTQRVLHVFFGATFFILGGLTVLQHSRKNFSKHPLLALYGFAVVFAGVLYFFFSGNTVLERILGAGILGWIARVSLQKQ